MIKVVWKLRLHQKHEDTRAQLIRQSANNTGGKKTLLNTSGNLAPVSSFV